MLNIKWIFSKSNKMHKKIFQSTVGVVKVIIKLEIYNIPEDRIIFLKTKL